MEERPGVLEALFDFSFATLITTRVIRFLYGLGVVFAAIAVLALIVKSFAQSTVGGILLLIFSPLIYILYVIAIRVWLELIIVIFRIEENTRPAMPRADQAP